MNQQLQPGARARLNSLDGFHPDVAPGALVEVIAPDSTARAAGWVRVLVPDENRPGTYFQQYARPEQLDPVDAMVEG